MGVKVLREHRDNTLAVGTIMLPPSPTAPVDSPNSERWLRLRTAYSPSQPSAPPPSPSPAIAAFDNMWVHGCELLLLPQRMTFAFELVEAVAGKYSCGVHLSGPNGVGKSGIGLLAYLLCAARGLPVVYIPSPSGWMEQASTRGGGVRFWLDAAWRQNADLILEHPRLREAFEGALLGLPDWAGDAAANKLRAAAQHHLASGFAVILDEMQHLTSVALSDTRSLAGDYVLSNWFAWDNSNNVFQRLSAASVHALCDAEIPPGEHRRLRFVEPLAADDCEALMSQAGSPCFVHPPARDYVRFLVGHVLRGLMTASKMLADPSVPPAEQRQVLRTIIWNVKLDDCSTWVKQLPPADRQGTADLVRDIVSGRVDIANADALYNHGLVYRTASDRIVRPVSPFSCAVMLRALAIHIRSRRQPLSSFPAGALRGYQLERQVLTALDGMTASVRCVRLDGTPAPAAPLRSVFSLFFQHLSEVVRLDVPVLYIPLDCDFACAAIRMPAEDDPNGEFCLVECGVTSPTSSKRVGKVSAYFQHNGVFTTLARTTGLPGVVALMYNGEVKNGKLGASAMAISHGHLPPLASPSLPHNGTHGAGASSAGMVVRVVDAANLSGSLGIT
jgi:hypothetical protein